MNATTYTCSVHSQYILCSFWNVFNFIRSVNFTHSNALRWILLSLPRCFITCQCLGVTCSSFIKFEICLIGWDCLIETEWITNVMRINDLWVKSFNVVFIQLQKATLVLVGLVSSNLFIFHKLLVRNSFYKSRVFLSFFFILYSFEESHLLSEQKILNLYSKSLWKLRKIISEEFCKLL